MRYEVTCPLKGFTGNVVGVDFADGVGHSDTAHDAGRAAYAYFERAGYRLTTVVEPEPDSGPASSDDEEFDPSEHKADEVIDYLDTADADEAQRVLDAEAAGKNRSTITTKGAAILAAKTPSAPAADDSKGATA